MRGVSVAYIIRQQCVRLPPPGSVQTAPVRTQCKHGPFPDHSQPKWAFLLRGRQSQRRSDGSLKGKQAACTYQFSQGPFCEVAPCVRRTHAVSLLVHSSQLVAPSGKMHFTVSTTVVSVDLRGDDIGRNEPLRYEHSRQALPFAMPQV